MSKLKTVSVLVWAFAFFALGACTTTSPNLPKSDPKPAPQTDIPKQIVTAPPAHPEPTRPAPTPKPAPKPDPVSIPTPTPTAIPVPESFAVLPHWQNTDPTPALMAFQKTCDIWKFRDDERWVHKAQKHFGQYADWREACEQALSTAQDPQSARAFFQAEFEPVPISSENAGDDKQQGLLTGYYAPQIPVRRLASLEFSEPILSKPSSPAVQNLPRNQLSVTSSPVLAYGRPIDVFFLQIQGSGQIQFPDGTTYRAAFDGHNDKPYTSIGRVLIKRGEMTKDQASKQSIEAWMNKAGYLKTKELMAHNARYVFFKTEHIIPNEGPKGAMGVPLIAMGSLAIDPKHYPYGALIWAYGNYPQIGGDYIGAPQGHLFVAQDTGKAIRGKIRGDVFFGSGAEAGDLAGVMKHKTNWMVLLPVGLVLKQTPIS